MTSLYGTKMCCTVYTEGFLLTCFTTGYPDKLCDLCIFKRSYYPDLLRWTFLHKIKINVFLPEMLCVVNGEFWRFGEFFVGRLPERIIERLDIPIKDTKVAQFDWTA